MRGYCGCSCVFMRVWMMICVYGCSANIDVGLSVYVDVVACAYKSMNMCYRSCVCLC